MGTDLKLFENRHFKRNYLLLDAGIFKTNNMVGPKFNEIFPFTL